jgi:hypothetical protein
MNIAFIPIDNRPVCYTLPKQICALNDKIKIFMPDRELLGGLKKCANVEKIFEWFNGLENIDVVVACLDTIAYGGLIPSRRSNESFEEIKNRVEKFRELLHGKKVFAFSSVMRISNNNVNQEEKEYWNKYGKKIFNYSYQLDKTGLANSDEIPEEILKDYLATRKRNFEINKLYLNWDFETLVFSKDDCAEFGLNVREAKELEKLGGFVKTGADEIPLTLLARAINTNGEFVQNNNKIKIAPIFLAPKYKHLISNYEDVSIEKSVLGQLELSGCEVCSENEADILLYVNNFENHQGEIVMDIDTKPFSGDWHEPQKPYIIADVRFANGADNAFVEKIFETGLGRNFLGYSAWNTSANSLGSLICEATAIWYQLKNSKGFNHYVNIIRFLDDWGYQANVRQVLRQYSFDEAKKFVKSLMQPFEQKVFEQFGIKYDTNYSFTWDRLFEVEVELI